MALHIDTSNVTLMSEFKSAIEDYVENYVQAYVNVTLGGTHKKKADSSWKFESGVDKPTELYISIPCDTSTFSHHWGVINIKRNDINKNLEYNHSDIDNHGAQIFFWINGSEFQYSYNTKVIWVNTSFSFDYQSVEKVTYANNTITLQLINHKHGSFYPGGSFSVDYHIW